MNLQAYANYRKANGLQGATHVSVLRAIQAGRLTPPAAVQKDGKWHIDPELADRQWLENTSSDPKYRLHVKAPAEPPPPPSPLEPREPGLKNVSENISGVRLHKEEQMTKAEAERRRAIIRAKREALALMEEEKQLGRITEFEKEAQKVAVMVRTNLRAIADRASAVLATMNSDVECKEYLLKEIDDALRSLS